LRRVALIPGGARGIGRGIGLALVERGWDVALAFRTSEKDADETVAKMQARGAAALAVRADVAQPEACFELVDRTLAWRGRIDALVHCAGPFHRVDILSETTDGWRAMFANNLDGLFFLTRLISPGMIDQRWGRILAFSMANADRLMAQTQITAHYLAKVGVLGLVRSLAKALAPHQITANAISPGFIDSGSADASELDQLTKSIPAGHVGTIDDVVTAALYLLSEEASYVSGTNLHVSGGWGL
jgi:3-oxoacyl-[acyl-carrier protein] reductase